jgi:hypothetical protein
MDDRADALRRRIATYRRRLAEGIDIELAQHYLAEIAAAEAELEQLDSNSERRD